MSGARSRRCDDRRQHTRSNGNTERNAEHEQADWNTAARKSDRVDHRKVAFYDRLGITPVADLYIPKNIDRSRRNAALVVGGTFGAVKEQASGLYAQTMAERGFIAIAHNPSYVDVGSTGKRP